MSCDAELYARLTETEKRLAALESTVAAAERLAQTPASSMPDAIEQTEVEPKWGCDAADPHGNYYCSLIADHDGAHACIEDGELLKSWRDTEPESVPQWRRLVDRQHQDLADLRTDGLYEAFSDVLECLSVHASAQSQPHDRALALARVIAVCEQEVGNGWQADPDRVWISTTWTIGWLMLPLSSNQWTLVADRAAVWLRELRKDGAA